MSLLAVAGANSSVGGYDIDNSVKTEATNNEWFYRSSPTASATQTKFTFSFWHKRTQITGYPADPYLMSQGSNARFHITGNTNPTLRFMFGGSSTELESSPRLRDTSAWYHIVLAVDTTQATASNRVKLYVNGEQISWDNSAYPSQNATSTWMSTTNMYFNTFNGDGAYDSSGYYAEVCVIDGQQLAPTEFGEFDEDSGIWKPIDVSNLTFGNEGFYLDFEDSSDLGSDVSGNNNDCTLNNLAAADQATDTPTNNFSVMNPLHNYYNEVTRFTVTEGGTSLTGNQSSTLWRGIPSTFATSNGKWYWEIERGYNGNGLLVGVGSADTGQTEWAELVSIANPSTKAKMLYTLNAGIYGYNSSTDAWQYGGTNFNTIGDVMSIAVDLDNGYMYFRKNGAAWLQSGNPSSGSSGTGAIALPWYASESTVFIVTVPNNNQDCRVNFGGYTTTANTLSYSDSNNFGAFKYEVPTGYYALCSKNLAEYG